MPARPLLAVVLAASLLLPAAAQAADAGATDFDDVVAAVLALPYNPAAQPTGLDAAFDGDDYPAAFPLTDLAGGACCTGPVPDQPPLADLAPPFAEFPEAFELIELASYDGTPLHAWAALRPGAPGVVVMHGFNTNGKYSVVRYAAFLLANGYSVIAPDHRDMGREWARGGSWHPDGTRHGQTLGWKEAQDLLVAAEWLRESGATGVGVLGFSEGAQNTILALGIDHDRVIDAALTFSAPADQRTLVQRSPATTAALLATVVGNPDICDYLAGVGARPEFAATPNFMLRHDSAVDTLDGLIGGGVAAPALHLYSNDDTLVPPWNATALASRTNAMDQQHTVLLAGGNHAYFADRWWTQMAALTWFGAWLDPTASHTTAVPTVARTPGGPPAADQQLDLTGVGRADGDAELRRTDVCAGGDPVGPTADLEVSGGGATFRLDGRRSYSGWDGHGLASWSIVPGDGSAPASGTDIRDAVVGHAYPAPGTYTATLTVIDDTGRSATATATITVDAAPPHGTGPRAVGGGWLAASAGGKINFGFNARSGAGGALAGHLSLRDGAAGVKVKIEAIDSLGGLAGSCGSVGAGPDAVEFTGTGTYNGTAASFRVCTADLGEPGSSGAAAADLFHLECTAGCGYATGDHAADDAIDGGNIQVRHPGGAAASGEPAPSNAAAAVLVLDPLLGGSAPQLLTVTAYGADGDPVAGVTVTLVPAGPDGAVAALEGVTDAGGIAVIPVTVGVEYAARAGAVTSNAVDLGGLG